MPILGNPILQSSHLLDALALALRKAMLVVGSRVEADLIKPAHGGGVFVDLI
jgi:hypothetical protein